MKNRAFKGIWIPKEIWLSTDLKVMEKLVLVEIDSLDNEEGCFASNDHFSKFFSLSKNRCSEIIKSLEKKGYITIEYVYQQGSKAISKRVIKCVRNIDNPIRKTEEGYSENREDNNTSFNNTFSNTSNKKDIVEQSSTTPLPYEEIVQYLNQKTNKNFKHTSKVTQRHIRARLAEGFTVSDFKQVIDKKCSDWLRDQKMKEYLRPETLFGTKFESYLNSKTTTAKQTGPYIDSCGLKVL
ncbi:MAG: conserved phage C-terminal domain-containing protein [Turicibacter sp.]|nr:conserved phage C-terminal domain-containing protein [Turicibacter sp.]